MAEERIDPLLDPNTRVTGGVRRINKIPLAIGIAVFLSFVLIVAYSAFERSSGKNADGDGDVKGASRADDLSRMAKDIVGDRRGIIGARLAERAEAKGEEEEKEEKKDDPAPSLPIATPDLKLPPAPPGRGGVTDENNEYIRRVRDMRFQEFEAAVRAKSGSPSSVSPKSGQGFYSPAGNPNSEDARARMLEARRQLEGFSSPEPARAYMDRLRALQNGGSVGGGGASPAFFGANAGARSGYEAFDSNLGARGDDRWKMEASLQPSLPFTLRAGTTVIPAVLITGINSDLPGQVMAQVSQDVYDTATGKYLLVPQGTRLAGQYGSDVAYGQERVLMAWQRLIFPDGQALDIGSMPGADSAGYSGLADRVNTHFFKAVSSAFLMSGVIAGVSLSQDRGSYSGNPGTQRSSDALSEALGQTMGQTLMQMLQKNLNLSPTLEIRPGYRLNVMVAKDLTFKRPYRKKR